MVCGFCGTNINPGFSTCPSCGATRTRVMGVFARLICALVSIVITIVLALTILGFALLAASRGVGAGLGVLSVGVPVMGACVFVVWLMKKTGSYQWIRRYTSTGR